METKEYETRLISFIDILGWTKAIKKMQFNELHKVINKVQDRCDAYSEQRRNELEKLEGFRINPMFFQVKFSMFSDAMAISMPIDFEARICNTTAELIREFIIQGFLLRGGITEGSLYHNNQTIFGSAIVEAHNLESEHAKYSRVLVDRSIVDVMKKSDPTSIIKDHLGEYVVDPFPILASGLTADVLCQMYELDKLVGVMEANLKSIVDLNALQKWEYILQN
jgi:class 3 adenylate cyclase